MLGHEQRDERQDERRVTSSKAVIVTPDIPTTTGGIGAFTWNLAKLLRMQGHDVLLIVAQPVAGVAAAQPRWRALCAAEGIESAIIDSATFSVPPGYTRYQRIAECVTDLIPGDADVVYLADWLATGADLVRKARYRRQPGPTLVMALHGCAQWVREGMRAFPSSREDLELDALEAYAARHSDFVVSPGAYMRSWAQDAGWKLPTDNRCRILHYPFFPPMTLPTTARVDAVPSSPAAIPAAFRRIVFFARLETRKGIELFVNGLGKLSGQPCLQTIEEVVLLGGAAPNAYGPPEAVVTELARRLNQTGQSSQGRQAIAVRALSTLNTFEAQSYLTERAADSLVIIPSLRENFPLTVIETSLIPGLNLLASNAGSIGEVLGPQGYDQLFEPFLSPFVRRLEAALLAGPQPDLARGHYDWQSANAAWIAFHDEAVAFGRARRTSEGAVCTSASQDVSDAQPDAQPDAAHEVVDRSVDVCVSYYNLGAYLPYMLESLERQTVQDFKVIVVNDGSTAPASVRVFEEQAACYTTRGWRFITTPNRGLSAARNAGAAAGTARYLIFLDADDVAAPTLVEHFRDAIEVSGDDCLSAYLHLFHGEGWDEDYAQQSLLHPYMPTGPSPALGLVSNPFGGACCIVTRAAFDAIGGFTTDVSRAVGYEDYEFYLRLMLAERRLDVVPEFLLHYRIRDDGMFRTNDLYENQRRILRVYERELQRVGLSGLALFATGLYEATRHQQSAITADVSSLVNHVSGHVVWKALRIKLRNQVARRFGFPVRDR